MRMVQSAKHHALPESGRGAGCAGTPMPSGTPSSDASGSQHRDDSTDGCSNPGSSHQSSSSSEESVGRGRSQGEVSSPVDKKDAALHLLLETGISAARACQALDATEEHASSPTAWAEEAQTWLAVDQEHADESAKLAEGMHASLEESQKETAPSCFEQTPAQLLEARGFVRLSAQNSRVPEDAHCAHPPPACCPACDATSPTPMPHPLVPDL
uniref:UBA domain-containing protein n=1 Tax=Auxenochlorella protothecoides TaxID=3075 RepID=A0A1D1ZUL7_AUXPR